MWKLLGLGVKGCLYLEGGRCAHNFLTCTLIIILRLDIELVNTCIKIKYHMTRSGKVYTAALAFSLGLLCICKECLVFQAFSKVVLYKHTHFL